MIRYVALRVFGLHKALSRTQRSPAGTLSAAYTHIRIPSSREKIFLRYYLTRSSANRRATDDRTAVSLCEPSESNTLFRMNLRFYCVWILTLSVSWQRA